MSLKEQTAFLERLSLLKAKLKSVPEKPGVYIHKNEKNAILYVGKAKNLASRLKSYFTGIDTHSSKTRALVQKIHDFDIIVTENEYESFLLENNMIKHNHPPYNILLKDDKTYPYLRIDTQEDWPRVTLVRRKKQDKALYFGPYIFAGQINQLMTMINRFFPLVKCTPFVFKTVSRPCYYYDIKKCLGPCKMPVKKEEYTSHLNHVIDLLKGKHKEIKSQIKESMTQASKATEFEKAALYRDQLHALDTLQQNTSINIDADLDFDLVASHWNRQCCTFHISAVRSGKLVGGNSIVIKQFFDPDEDPHAEKKQIFSSFLCQYYQSREVPNLILFPQANDVLEQETHSHIENYLKTKIHFLWDVLPKKVISKSKDIYQLSLKNAEEKFKEQIKIDEGSSQMMLSLQNLLHLDTLPRWVECYDISTFQGSQTVASQVVFRDGLPSKKDYKKYIIKETVDQMDDFASLREVIRRRFHKRDHIPDVLVIDGGKPQIREVAWTLKSLGLESITLIGLAKSRTEKNFQSEKVNASSERVVVPKRDVNGLLEPAALPDTLTLKSDTPAFRLLTQMRDEAHRFAISFHRQRRDKSSMQSVFDQVKGLGSKRKKTLLDHYPNLSDMASTSAKIISEKTKIPLHIILELKQKIDILFQ